MGVSFNGTNPVTVFFNNQEVTAGGNVQVSASANFSQFLVSEYNSEEIGTLSAYISRGQLPASILGNNASINLSRSGNQIFFDFIEYEEYMKGYNIVEIPTSITITEVRRQS